MGVTGHYGGLWGREEGLWGFMGVVEVYGVVGVPWDLWVMEAAESWRSGAF